MTVIILEAANENIRGVLGLWLIEPKPGVFVGKISSKIRDFLWNEIKKNQSEYTGALIIYSAQNEQGYKIETIGSPYRAPIDLDGLALIKISKTQP